MPKSNSAGKLPRPSVIRDAAYNAAHYLLNNAMEHEFEKEFGAMDEDSWDRQLLYDTFVMNVISAIEVGHKTLLGHPKSR